MIHDLIGIGLIAVLFSFSVLILVVAALGISLIMDGKTWEEDVVKRKKVVDNDRWV